MVLWKGFCTFSLFKFSLYKHILIDKGRNVKFLVFVTWICSTKNPNLSKQGDCLPRLTTPLESLKPELHVIWEHFRWWGKGMYRSIYSTTSANQPSTEIVLYEAERKVCAFMVQGRKCRKGGYTPLWLERSGKRTCRLSEETWELAQYSDGTGHRCLTDIIWFLILPLYWLAEFGRFISRLWAFIFLKEIQMFLTSGGY